MSAEQVSNLKFDIGHVLFIDIVGYSKGLINEQSESLLKLKEIVRGTEQFRIAEAEGKLLRLPTGDGGALVFRNTPEAPVLCALEISKALKSYPELRVRMGIHSGPVNEVTDLNEQANIAGAGINLAQRVMDCGDAGHILLSKRVTDDLEHYPQWRSHLHNLGECEVKHGVRVSVVNLYTEELGNPEVPEKFRQAKEKEQAAPTSAASDAPAHHDEGFWVAVLPFKYGGSNSDLTALAEGLTEEIVTGLSRFSYLKVISRSSTSRYANESVDVQSAGKQLSARYVMEGSLRQAGTRLRIAVQLVDTSSGAHLWAETYDRPFQSEGVFELQDELVSRIVSTCADRFGVLARSISDAVRGTEAGQLGTYEALMRGFGYHHRLTAAEHAEARGALERAVERAPFNADCWAMLSWIYSHEYAHGFNVRPSSLERALAAARRAVDIAPSNQLAQQALAVVLFFRKERAGCLSAAERAMALNPLDTSNEAMFLITFTGDWDRGCALIRRAMDLNPHHPRWYRTVLGINEYRLANYRAVVDEVVKANAPDVFWTNILLAAAHGCLGELTAARNALRDLLAQKEDFAQSARSLLSKWLDPELVEHLIDGLRKAGLEIAGEEGTAN